MSLALLRASGLALAALSALPLCRGQEQVALPLRPALRAPEGSRTIHEVEFESFVQRFGKSYASEGERALHFQAFCANYDLIQARNAEGRSYQLGITEFADLTNKQFVQVYGLPALSRAAAPAASRGNATPSMLGGHWEPACGQAFAPLTADLVDLPSSVDWRHQGAVTDVENQGACGSCWSFAAAGAIEGAWKIAGGPLRQLSEQQFMDCGGSKWGNNGCHGGAPVYAFRFAMWTDICSAGSYKYKAADGSCRPTSNCNVALPAGGVKGCMAVDPDDEQALLAAVAQQPVAVAIDGDATAFQLYRGGVITQDCGDTIDHGVLLVGYGTDNGQDYWLVKNSWGGSWGEGGFVRMARGRPGEGECGILSQPSFPVIDKRKVTPGAFYVNWGAVAMGGTAAAICGFLAVSYLLPICKRRLGQQRVGVCDVGGHGCQVSMGHASVALSGVQMQLLRPLHATGSYCKVDPPGQVLGSRQTEGAQPRENLNSAAVESPAQCAESENSYVQLWMHGARAELERTTAQNSRHARTKKLCRKMKAVVMNVVQELRPFQDPRPPAPIQFLKTLADMQELTLKRLTTTVEEEKSRQELLEHYKSREAEASKRRQQLEKDLSHIRRECERAQSQRTEILTKLKADLLDVKDTKTERMSALRLRYETRMREHQEAFDAKKDELQKKINALKDSNKKLKNTSNDEETDQKKKAKRYEMDVENVIQRYDTEVRELAKTFSENQEHLKKEQRQLSELREHFEKVDEEKACISAEEAVVAARRSKLDAERRKRDESSGLLQAFWRGITQREMYGAMKKSKKKKGGGKKGK
ncbi:unnamed protein product [Polarella glacialis]|uniref:Dynein regulatory complex protein 10 n=1 Tax=Polarella glacialis TaxID=89957 RepID=A0A813J3D0_POLGL|nr:unnamed protein product [Polarella glacialis]